MGWKLDNGKDIMCNRNYKKSGVVALISEKIEYETRSITNDKKGSSLSKDQFI